MKSTRIAELDTATAKLKQLHALLISINGDGFNNFLELSEEKQENLLWLAADLAKQAKDALEVIVYAQNENT